MAVSVSDTDFNKALEYIDKAYDLTDNEFYIDVKVGFYINEAKKVMTSNPDKALELLDISMKIKETDEAKSLIFSICIDMAKAYIEEDINKALAYINKGLSYGYNDELKSLLEEALKKLALQKGEQYVEDHISNTDYPEAIKEQVGDSLEDFLSDIYPEDPALVITNYLNAIAVENTGAIAKYEYNGDKFDLYFYERDLTPKKYIPKGSRLNIVKTEDISLEYNTPPNEKFYRVLYKNNNTDTLIYLLLTNEDGLWKVYGIV